MRWPKLELPFLLIAALMTSAGVAGSVTQAGVGAQPAAPAAAAKAADAPESDAPGDDGAAGASGDEAAPVRLERDTNTCLTCHLGLPEKNLRQPAEKYEKSVHKDDRIGCVGCHGGNATDPTVHAHDLSMGFAVRPPHEKIADLCGGCHADPVFVRRFAARLPIDQQKLYELSVHGKLASAADTSAPTCTTCHGIHDILSPANPNAKANKRGVVELCAECHADEKYMAPYNMDTDQVEQWKGSTHGKAFAGGSDVAPTCTGCHSPHGGTLPGTVTVAAFCGRCHEEEQELFYKSPHARAFRSLGLGECVPCHGDHDVTTTSWLAGMAPDSACSRCHARDEKPKQVAQTISSLLSKVNAREHAVSNAIVDAREIGLYVPNAAYSLDKLRTAKLRLGATVHTLDLQQLKEHTEELEVFAQDAEASIAAARRDREIERRGYFVALATAILLFGLLVLKAVQLAQRRSRSAS